MEKNKDISLVLGSGGARGYAHIGVIEELIQSGYNIKAISGASMGALIGGLYAAGKLEEFKEWVLTLDVLDVAKLIDLSFSKSGMINGEKVFSVLEDMIGDINIEDLPIPFTAVAVDLIKQKEIWIEKGSLLDAIRASIAIPTIFTPKKIKGMYLVDGGILNPLPIAPTVSNPNDITVVVSLYGSSKKYDIELPTKEKEKEKKLSSSFYDLAKKANSYFNKEKTDKIEEMGMYDILWNTIDTMQNTIIEYKQAGYTPDLAIYIPKNSCDFYEFNKAYEMIELGKAAAKESLSTL